jgi:hypothetical protein
MQIRIGALDFLMPGARFHCCLAPQFTSYFAARFAIIPAQVKRRHSTKAFNMFMYLPFLLGLLAAIGIVAGLKKIGYALWLATIAVTLYWFSFHATSPLNLSF